ncbi:helix-turn-helix transcriptional regulator [Actinomycetaceae bacterium L2_0104]
MISADAIRGYIDIMILSILRGQPSYAYELAKTIAELSQDQYNIKQTTLYSAVKRLEASGWVDSFAGVSESGKQRTYYKLTTIGEEGLVAKCREWEATKSVVDQFVKGVL